MNGFKWKTNISKFDEKFKKNCDEDSDKGNILEVDVKYPKDLHDCIVNYIFIRKNEIYKMQ